MKDFVTRRRLLRGSLFGVPLLAACSAGRARDEPAIGRLTPQASADAARTSTETPPPAPAEAEAAVPQAPATAQSEPAQSRPPDPAPRVRTVILDPGHGGDEIGAASAIAGLPNLLEKDSNLAFAFRLRQLLEADGVRVVMTRESDGRAFGWVRPDPNATANSTTSPTITLSRSDLQARVDYANNNGGDLFLSLHSNDAGDISENGVEVWYCEDREDGAANGVLAQILLENALDGLRGYGYRATNRGTKEDRYFRVRNGRNFHLFVLGPRNTDAQHPRATMMPSALIENLFMRHARDQWVLRDPTAREALTQAMRRSVHQFFEWRGG